MASILAWIVTSRPVEPVIGYMMSNNKNHDDGLFTRKAAVSGSLPQPNMTVTSSDCGPSGSALATEYSSAEIGGSGKVPSFRWSAPAGKSVAEYVFVSEDPDAPMKEPIVHGVYYGIPASKTSVTPADLEVASEAEKKLKGGFWYGQNRRGSVYIPPRPIKNHGPHRYFFSVIALSEKLNVEKLKKEAGDSAAVSPGQILKEIEGKVLGWGEWVGPYENKW